MFSRLKILLSNDKRFIKLLDNAVKTNNLVFLKKIVSSKKFQKDKYVDEIYSILKKCIDFNKLNVIEIIIENNKWYFRNSFDACDMNLLNYTVSRKRIDILKYLYNKFYISKYNASYLFTTSIEYYDKEIFDFLYDNIECDINYDSYKILKYCVFYNRYDIFNRIINDEKYSKSFINNKNNFYELISYCIRNNYINYLQIIIDKMDFDIDQNKNEFLLLSMDNVSETTSLMLLNNKKVIDKYHRPSLQRCLKMCISYNKKLTFNKLLELDFIDISYNNNEPLITAIKYNNYEFVKLILDNKKIDLSKCDNSFEIINEDIINNKIFMVLINIPSFRKYLSDEKNDLIKPIYNIKKINRTLDE